MIIPFQDWEWDYISLLRSSSGMAASSGWKVTKGEGSTFFISLPIAQSSVYCELAEKDTKGI